MESIVRAVLIFGLLHFVTRLSGRRTLGEMTTFDFVLLLVIGESTQQALLGEDFSMTNAALVIFTLVGLNVGLSYIKQISPRADRWLDGVPSLLVSDGVMQKDCMRFARVGEEDIMEAARIRHGLSKFEQIRFAVLEKNGAISIVPFDARGAGN